MQALNIYRDMIWSSTITIHTNTLIQQEQINKNQYNRNHVSRMHIPYTFELYLWVIAYWLDMDIYVRVLERSNIARRQGRNINYAPKRVHWPFIANAPCILLLISSIYIIGFISFFFKISKSALLKGFTAISKSKHNLIY